MWPEARTLENLRSSDAIGLTILSTLFALCTAAFVPRTPLESVNWFPVIVVTLTISLSICKKSPVENPTELVKVNEVTLLLICAFIVVLIPVVKGIILPEIFSSENELSCPNPPIPYL